MYNIIINLYFAILKTKKLNPNLSTTNPQSTSNPRVSTVPQTPQFKTNGNSSHQEPTIYSEASASIDNRQIGSVSANGDNEERNLNLSGNSSHNGNTNLLNLSDSSITNTNERISEANMIANHNFDEKIIADQSNDDLFF